MTSQNSEEVVTISKKEYDLLISVVDCVDGFREAFQDRNFGDAEAWFHKLKLTNEAYWNHKWDSHDEEVLKDLKDLDHLVPAAEKVSKEFNHIFGYLVSSIMRRLPLIGSIKWTDWPFMRSLNKCSCADTEDVVHIKDKHLELTSYHESAFINGIKGRIVLKIDLKFFDGKISNVDPARYDGERGEINSELIK